MYPTDLTVAAVIEHEGRYLLIEERAMGRLVVTQPGGHIEAGESPEQAVVRETLEESGCDVTCSELIGVYLWIHPQTRQQFLRIVYAAQFLHCDETRALDAGVMRRLWLTLDELESRQPSLRSPAVRDYVAGKRQADSLLTGMLPLQQNVDQVLAAADLV